MASDQMMVQVAVILKPVDQMTVQAEVNQSPGQLTCYSWFFVDCFFGTVEVKAEAAS